MNACRLGPKSMKHANRVLKVPQRQEGSAHVSPSGQHLGFAVNSVIHRRTREGMMVFQRQTTTLHPCMEEQPLHFPMYISRF